MKTEAEKFIFFPNITKLITSNSKLDCIYNFTLLVILHLSNANSSLNNSRKS